MASVGMEQQHHDLSEITTSPGTKRKRNTESMSPDSRRNKRGAPAAAMTVADSEAQAFLENTVSIAQAAHDQVNVDDFNVLAQATANDHAESTPDTNNVSSTAAAALNIYPSLHVPQPTEETFVSPPSAETHHDENGFNSSAVNQPNGLPMASSVSLQPANDVQQEQQRYTPAPSTKPAVGSEEWHKMRKDNHKEGLFTCPHRGIRPTMADTNKYRSRASPS